MTRDYAPELPLSLSQRTEDPPELGTDTMSRGDVPHIWGAVKRNPFRRGSPCLGRF